MQANDHGQPHEDQVGISEESPFFDEMHLCIARLTEPSVSRGGRDKNLSLETLIDRVERDKPGESGLVADLRRLYDEARDQADPIRTKRNKMIAHSDLPTLTGEQETFLNAGRARFESIFERFDEILRSSDKTPGQARKNRQGSRFCQGF